MGICLTTPLQALSPDQELKACKSALLSQINEQKRIEVEGCPVGQKLLLWLGILRNPEQFTPQELTTFLTSHSHWPHHEKLCQKTEEVIKKKASPKEILTWFRKYPPQTPDGVILYAKILINHQEKAKAIKIAAEAWRTREMTRAEEKNFSKHFSHFLQEKDHIARLHFLLWNENVEEAKRFMVHVPVAQRKVAAVRIAFLEGHTNALQKMQGLPAKLRQDEGLLYEQAKWHRKRKEYQEAAQILLSMHSKSAYADNWWKERNYIAREFIALKDYQAAYHIAQHHGLEPKTENFANAEWLLGWLALRFLDKPNEAERHFKVLLANVKGAISKARGAYWIGRVHERQEEIALAEKAYRNAAKYKTTYYGQLAAAKLRENPYPVLAGAPKATTAEKKRFEQSDLVKASYILKSLGNDAAHELSKFLLHIADQSKTREERELAVQLAHKLSPYDVVWAAKKAGYSEPVLLKIGYPIHTVPRKGQVIPEHALVMAVTYQESRFNPTAQSSAGAMGLMQLRPLTAAEEAEKLGIAHKESKLFDSQHNLLLGSSHLSRLLDSFEHSYILTLAAYNAGPTPVRRWLTNFGDPRLKEIDIIDWIELIPYSQTRDYVMRVLENVTNYRSLKGPPKKTLIHDLQR